MTRAHLGPAGWRKPLAIASALLTAFALSACSAPWPHGPEHADGGARRASDTALTAAWQESAFAPLYRQRIEWRPCTPDDGLPAEGPGAAAARDARTAVECGRVRAPMNWADPGDERTIELAVMKLSATVPDRAAPAGPAKPLFINPGGPGLSASSLALELAEQETFTTVLAEYDVYAVDPRGVGASSPLGCQSPSTIGALRIAECVEKNPLTHYMGTSQAARDMEMMRALSGADRLHYLGYSYGTVLGATYATLFPDKAGRMVLDSALAGDWAQLTTGFDQQLALADEIDAMVTALCADGTTCPFRDTEGLLALRDSLDASPWKGSDGAELSGGLLVQFLIDTLYKAPAERAQRLSALTKASSGDRADIDALLALAGLSASPAGAEPESGQSGAEDTPADGEQSGAADHGQSTAPDAFGPLFDPTGEIITCHSAEKHPDPAALVERITKSGMPPILGGPEVNDQALEDFIDLRCAVLPEVGSDITGSFHAPDVATPILVIGTTGDHATPYAFSERLVEQLGNARLVTFDAHGHGLSYSGRSALLDRTITDYLVDGAIPEAGTTIPDGADL